MAEICQQCSSVAKKNCSLSWIWNIGIDAFFIHTFCSWGQLRLIARQAQWNYNFKLNLTLASKANWSLVSHLSCYAVCAHKLLLLEAKDHCTSCKFSGGCSIAGERQQQKQICTCIKYFYKGRPRKLAGAEWNQLDHDHLAGLRNPSKLHCTVTALVTVVDTFYITGHCHWSVVLLLLLDISQTWPGRPPVHTHWVLLSQAW